MKVKIELIEEKQEEEIIIRCRQINRSIQEIHQYIMEQSGEPPKLTFYQDSQEFYFSLDEIIFFETADNKVFAHTKDNCYTIRYRLYELEQMLPQKFLRISKSAIVNIGHIYSIQRNLASASRIQFRDSHKEVYVSRSYYNGLRERLEERSAFL